MSRNLLIGLAIVVAGLRGGAAWVVMRPGPVPDATGLAAGGPPVQETDGDLPVVAEMTLGDPAAAVTVIEYASFTCPHCRNFHAQVFPRLKAEYIDPGRIFFVYREVYFDKFGLWAGMIARCADPTAYFTIADLIYERQQDWLGAGSDAAIANRLREVGLVAGLSSDRLDACLADGRMAQALVAEFQRNAGADEINATPSFVIDGEKYANMTYTDFAALLDARLGGN